MKQYLSKLKARLFKTRCCSEEILNGILGHCVGDALGVPVEFFDRESLKANPVTKMRSYGTHNQAQGTWSDDTSMTLCLLDSISRGLNYTDIMSQLLHWANKGGYTPHGDVFDIGGPTRGALVRHMNGTSPLKCGGKEASDNGSLMRVLPILFYLRKKEGAEFYKHNESFNIIHNVSSLTHQHKRSYVACSIYILIASEIMNGQEPKNAVLAGIKQAADHYAKSPEYTAELGHFSRINETMDTIDETEIKSGGYVVDTLEAALWCVLTTSSYEECVLKAVKLGDDTDTVGAIAGSLAGLKYGYESIPDEWLDSIPRLDFIKKLCNQL